jgi:hypothetical protein
MVTHPLIIMIARRCLRAKADEERWQWFLGIKPSEFIDPAWADLRQQFQDGDELWRFRTDEESWRQLMGWAGYALVRDGAVVGAVVTAQN